MDVRALLIGVGLALLAAPQATAAVCPDPCPYRAVASIGDRAGGQLRLPQAVAVDAGGRVFVGDQYTGAIQRFGPDGALQRVFGAPGTRDGEFGAIVGLAIDHADGSLYAADAESDRIQHFSADGEFIGAFGRLGSGPGEFRFADGSHVANPAQGGVAVGNGKVWVADVQNDRIQSFPLDDVRGATPSVAGATIFGVGIVNNPQGLWAGDRLYVADGLNNVIRAFGADGSLLQTIGLGGPGHGPGQFNGAWDVAVDGQRLYAVDDNNHRIQVFDAQSGALLGSWGGFGRAPGQLEYPRALTLGPGGAVYVANTADGRVDKFSGNGAFQRSFGFDGRLPGQFISPGYLAAAPDGGAGVPDIEGNRFMQFGPDNGLLATYGSVGTTPERVSRPQGIGFGGDFNATTADSGNDRLVHRAFYGDVLNVLGAPGAGPGQLEVPLGVAVDASGIYVADSVNDRVQHFGFDGSPLRSFGPSFNGGLSNELDSPRGVAISPANGLIYVASGGSDRILAIDPQTGLRVLTFGGTGDGNGQLELPGGIAIDPAGRVYVADINNHRVQRFSALGQYEAQWGSEGVELGQFEHPLGVATDCTGAVWVSDRDNNRVLRFTLSDPRSATCAPTPVRPTPAPPPPPETPAPVPVAPKVTPKVVLSLRKSTMTRVLTRRTLRLAALCDRACTLTIASTLAPQTGSARAKRRLRAVVRRLPAGRRTAIVLRLSRGDARVLRRALRRRTGLRLTVTARATAKGARSARLTRHYRARR